MQLTVELHFHRSTDVGIFYHWPVCCVLPVQCSMTCRFPVRHMLRVSTAKSVVHGICLSKTLTSQICALIHQKTLFSARFRHTPVFRLGFIVWVRIWLWHTCRLIREKITQRFHQIRVRCLTASIQFCSVAVIGMCCKNNNKVPTKVLAGACVCLFFEICVLVSTRDVLFWKVTRCYIVVSVSDFLSAQC